MYARTSLAAKPALLSFRTLTVMRPEVLVSSSLSSLGRFCAGQQLSLAVEDNPGGSAVAVQNSHDLAHVLQSGGILIGIGQVRDGAGNRVELVFTSLLPFSS